MTYLSDTARVVLAAAAQRDDLSVLPFPDGVKAKGGAEQKVLAGLLKRGLVRAIETEGRPDRVVITREGMAAMNIEPDDEVDGGQSGPAQPDTGATAAEASAADKTPTEATKADTAAAPADSEPEAAPGEPTPKPTPRAGTKQAQMIELLKRPEGATVEQIAKATGWQHHTIAARSAAR